MRVLSSDVDEKKTNLYKWASALALITIFYNIFEGLVSVFFGLKDETIALLGFGVDSFVGREAFQKAKGDWACSCKDDCR